MHCLLLTVFAITVLCIVWPVTVQGRTRDRRRDKIVVFPDIRERNSRKRFVNDVTPPPEDGTNHKPDGKHGTRDHDVIWVDRGPGSRGHRGGNSSHHRVTRQASNTQNVIELLLVVDNKAFRRYLARNNGNVPAAMSEVTRYYAGIMQSVNARFAKLDSGGFAVRALLTRVLILTAPSPLVTGGLDSNGDGDIDAYRALDRMESLSRRAQYIYPHDFLMLMSGYDLFTPRGTNIVGVTYGEGICTTDRIGLVEDDGDEQMAATLTHELSHSIGAGHDAQDNSCPNNYYVMAPSTGIPFRRSQSFNPFTFSQCSMREIRSFLTNSYTRCLRSRKNPPGSVLNVDALTQIPLGQQYSADQQCINTYGMGSRFCREQYNRPDFNFNDMCYRLRCRVPGRDGCTSTLPFFGTTCGNRQWCREGSCVFDPRAPPVMSPTCPQGDDPTIECSPNLCATEENRQFRCCATCARLLQEPTPAPTAAPTTARTPSADDSNTMSVVGEGGQLDGGSVTMSLAGDAAGAMMSVRP